MFHAIHESIYTKIHPFRARAPMMIWVSFWLYANISEAVRTQGDFIMDLAGRQSEGSTLVSAAPPAAQPEAVFKICARACFVLGYGVGQKVPVFLNEFSRTITLLKCFSAF